STGVPTVDPDADARGGLAAEQVVFQSSERIRFRDNRLHSGIAEDRVKLGLEGLMAAIDDPAAGGVDQIAGRRSAEESMRSGGVGDLIFSLNIGRIALAKEAWERRRIDLQPDRPHKVFIIRNTGQAVFLSGQKTADGDRKPEHDAADGQTIAQIGTGGVMGLMRESVINICHVAAHDRAEYGSSSVM